MSAPPPRDQAAPENPGSSRGIWLRLLAATLALAAGVAALVIAIVLLRSVLA
jgi:hypothetical protein